MICVSFRQLRSKATFAIAECRDQRIVTGGMYHHQNQNQTEIIIIVILSYIVIIVIIIIFVVIKVQITMIYHHPSSWLYRKTGAPKKGLCCPQFYHLGYGSTIAKPSEFNGRVELNTRLLDIV